MDFQVLSCAQKKGYIIRSDYFTVSIDILTHNIDLILLILANDQKLWCHKEMKRIWKCFFKQLALNATKITQLLNKFLFIICSFVVNQLQQRTGTEESSSSYYIQVQHNSQQKVASVCSWRCNTTMLDTVIKSSCIYSFGNAA